MADKVKYDKDFKKVMKCLKLEMGWPHIEVLPTSMQGLINDVIKATKKINKPV